ncbi:MAG TPA: alpha/beta hydrolase [Aggregatilinea sp.]|jgi:pimeloyl-ACP methyl ester carboxylesterase|uniref:alpha/beta fold hydrolase n=1 Tax=Aggregatilinea sp. TaxID=2806333 RepID=UPI002BCF85D5|nr:alpha/beta hydrolase [Aggregatilinea sp.]HML20417.1 alpha/beta hydrolase [Aggregatilinea sp.]
MPHVSVGTETLYVAERKLDGSAYPPLVLVHGAGGSHLDWPASLRRLPGARIVAVDLPGHGKSSGSGCEDTQAYAEAVSGLFDALGIARAIVAGHSMGGGIAQQIALNWPEHVAGLVLIGTGSKLPVAPDLPERVVSDRDATLPWIVDGSWSAGALPAWKQRNLDNLQAVRPDVLRADYLACQRFDVREQLGRIAAPTLILVGSEDRMVPPKFSATLAGRIPNSTLVQIDGAGHMLPLEQAEAVADVVEEWLAEQTWAS